MGHIQVDVVVTTYHKERSIAECLRRLIRTLDSRPFEFRVYVVDDASSDCTVKEARSVDDIRITVIESSVNQGKGAQIKNAVQHSDAELIAIFDGDLDIHPKSLVNAINILTSRNLDVAVGTKSHSDSEVSYPAMRRHLSRGFQIISRLLFDLNIRDTQTGLKVFRGDLLRHTAPDVIENGFLFDLELLARLSKKGCIVDEVPVAIDFDFTSTIGLRTIAEMMVDIFRVKRTLTRSRSSLS